MACIDDSLLDHRRLAFARNYATKQKVVELEKADTDDAGKKSSAAGHAPGETFRRLVRITGLPSANRVRDSRLLELFEEYGVVEKWERKRDVHSSIPDSTLAIVTYRTKDEAKAAINGLQNTEIIHDVRLSVRLWVHQNRAQRFDSLWGESAKNGIVKDQRALREYEVQRQRRKTALEEMGVEMEEEEGDEGECSLCGQMSSPTAFTSGACCQRSSTYSASSLSASSSSASSSCPASFSCFSSSDIASSASKSCSASSSALKDYLTSLEEERKDPSPTCASFSSRRPVWSAPRSRIHFKR